MHKYCLFALLHTWHDAHFLIYPCMRLLLLFFRPHVGYFYWQPMTEFNLVYPSITVLLVFVLSILAVISHLTCYIANWLWGFSLKLSLRRKFELSFAIVRMTSPYERPHVSWLSSLNFETLFRVITLVCNSSSCASAAIHHLSPCFLIFHFSTLNFLHIFNGFLSISACCAVMRIWKLFCCKWGISCILFYNCLFIVK